MYTVRIAIALLIVAALMPVDVQSHCHTTKSCEKAEKHLTSKQRWDRPGDKVKYWVNQSTFPGLPEMDPDVHDAAATWTDISFNNQRVRFKLKYAGDVTRTPGYKDGWSVVGWGRISDPDFDDIAPAETMTWHVNGSEDREITEQDLIFNYYFDYAAHDLNNVSQWCLLQVATHEFGHWIRLYDVGDEVPPDDYCSEYEHYTMYYSSWPVSMM